MTTTDTILFVKETKTCHYIMVIHTPRLCGEPGFKTRVEQGEEAYIRCRQIVDANALIDRSLPESPHAHGVPRKQREPILKPAAPPPQEQDGGKKPSGQNDLVRRALAALFGGGGDLADVPFEVVTQEHDGDEIIFEFVVDEDGNVHPQESSGTAAVDFDLNMEMSETERKAMIDALRAAGYYDMKASDSSDQKRKSQGTRERGTSDSSEGEQDEEDPAIINSNIRDEL